MFRNWLSTAWNNLARSPLQSFIAIGGLAIGLTMAILAAIVAVNQFSYDHFVPDHDRLYFAILENHAAAGDSYSRSTSYDLAGYLRQEFPEIETVTRVAFPSGVFRHGNVQARENYSWVDPNFFELFRVPALYGDLDSALARPDGIVITRQIARKYFGYDNVVGQTLQFDHTHLMKVTAVIDDLPANATNLETDIYASSLAPFSQMNLDTVSPGMSPNGNINNDMWTIVRLAPGASLERLNRGASALVSRFVPRTLPYRRAIHFEKVDQAHLSSTVYPDMLPRLLGLGAAAVVTLVLACMNFINLSTARSTQRSIEVAVRKVSGAGRTVLIVQFLGESILQVMFALVVAIALTEWSLPVVNAFLNSGAVFDYWRSPGLIALLFLGALVVGLAAGAYPALIISSFRPAAVLKGLTGGSARGEIVRKALVTIQFAALMVLSIAAVIVFEQNQYASTQALRISTDRMVLLRAPVCDETLKTRIAALPGVEGAACSGVAALPITYNSRLALPIHGGAAIVISMVPAYGGLFELYGLRPVAGRFFRDDIDVVPPNSPTNQIVHYIINQTALRKLGYSSPEAAIGKPLLFPAPLSPTLEGKLPIVALPGVIIGIVPDFSFTPLTTSPAGDKGIPPTAYSAGAASSNLPLPPAILHIKLTGVNTERTLAAIDGAWRDTGSLDPARTTFLDAFVQNLELPVLRQGQAFATFAIIAMLLACLGLFGVSLFTAARRTKEIGIRKAMGASNADILALLLWQFSKPVMWANLVAWPLAWWIMDRWLSGFPYHISLSLWPFIGASAAALGIALATVLSQAVIVARQKPVLALRHE